MSLLRQRKLPCNDHMAEPSPFLPHYLTRHARVKNTFRKPLLLHSSHMFYNFLNTTRKFVAACLKKKHGHSRPWYIYLFINITPFLLLLLGSNVNSSTLCNVSSTSSLLVFFFFSRTVSHLGAKNMDVFIPEEYVMRRRSEKRTAAAAGKRSEDASKKRIVVEEGNVRPPPFRLENELIIASTSLSTENIIFSCFSA